ncbi:MAG TPA: O-antigen ligase family protein [Bacteroidia bacterium]|jgi:putative inorganic carbon (HCO3(-)) transporter|nr:O-antigen ligase family protein [Bacteroidia bacterium]
MNKLLQKSRSLLYFYIFCGLYILGLCITLFIGKTLFLPYALLPIALGIILVAFFSFDAFVFSIVFFTPLAVTLKEMGLNSDVDLSIPTEPFMAAVLLVLPVYQLYSKFITKEILAHPITKVIFLQLAWMAFTCITSEMPLVSIKYFIARLWFLASGYFMMAYLFNKKEGNIFKYLWLYIIPLTGVATYITIQHATYNFDEHVADWIPSPFYNDHTAYAAALAMYVPPLAGFLFLKRFTYFQKLIAVFCLVVICTAVVFSFTRGAWVGLAAAVVLLVFLLLKIKFRTIIITVASLGVLFLVFQTQILILLNQNNTASGNDASQNVESISNIKTDDSNIERLNRWSCAIKMFQQRPLVGWGPGTYMFQYAPFQKTSEKSLISTNAGTNGNAHSEYLGPLSEQGVLGLVGVLALLITVFNIGFKTVYNAKDKGQKILAVIILTGLTTYFVHGFLNNFLDTDKLSIPFWGFIAAVVILDVKQKAAAMPTNEIKEEPVS